jgi:acetyl-CoA acetyltransferase
MYEYGTTSEQFGAIAVACRKHGALTPNAVWRTPITLAEHQESRMIVDPFHRLDCCGTTDGAGAVIVTSAERARDLAQRPVYVLGLGQHASHADIQYAASMPRARRAKPTRCRASGPRISTWRSSTIASRRSCS